MIDPKALAFTLRFEGLWSNDPADTGGATMRGVTQAVYTAYRKRHGKLAQSVLHIEDDELNAIYEDGYWVPSGAAIAPRPLNLALFDTAVNFGPRRAVEFLQSALGVTVDGQLGPKARKALITCDARVIAQKIVASRIRYRYTRVISKPSQRKFLRGWLNRDNALKAAVQ